MLLCIIPEPMLPYQCKMPARENVPQAVVLLASALNAQLQPAEATLHPNLSALMQVHVKNRCAWINQSSDPKALVQLVHRFPNIKLWFSGAVSIGLLPHGCPVPS